MPDKSKNEINLIRSCKHLVCMVVIEGMGRFAYRRVKKVNQPDFCALLGPKMLIMYSKRIVTPQSWIIYFIYQAITNIYFKEIDELDYYQVSWHVFLAKSCQSCCCCSTGFVDLWIWFVSVQGNLSSNGFDFRGIASENYEQIWSVSWPYCLLACFMWKLVTDI